MVEFTEEEKAKYQERLRLRAELKAKQEREAKTEAKPAPAKKHGILEKVADKAESARAKYNNVKTQGGRIKNAIAPTKPKKQPRAQVRHAYSGVSNRRHRAPPRQRVVYVPAPQRQNYDPLQNHIMGPPSGKSGASHLNDMIGLGSSGGANSMDFMNTMIHGKSSGKKKDEF